MRVVVYPADAAGCGHYRLIWPARHLQQTGHDVVLVMPDERKLRIQFAGGKVANVSLPAGTDVVVLQRVTDVRVLGLVEWLHARGIATVIDIDDDLNAIHPSNPVWMEINPNRARHEARLLVKMGRVAAADEKRAELTLARNYHHSWNHLLKACQVATLVTCSTPALLPRYAAHGRGVLLENRVPDHYLELVHDDSDVIGWPAMLATHPNDPAALGNALARVVGEGASFRALGVSRPGDSLAQAFGLRAEPETTPVMLEDWPLELSRLGIGIVPLADTRFNAAKSWLKPLELSAAGVPWVASPRAEYRRLHQLGAGVLADKPKDWYRTLRRLLDDQAYRLELSQAGRDLATQQRLSAHSWRWWEAWDQALEIQRGPRTASAGRVVTNTHG